MCFLFSVILVCLFVFYVEYFLCWMWGDGRWLWCRLILAMIQLSTMIFLYSPHSPVSLTYRCINLYRHIFYYIHYSTTIHFWTLYYNISQLWCRTCTSARGLKPPALLLPSPVSRTFILFWAAPYWSSASRDYHRSGDNCHPETGTHCLPVCLNLTPSSCYNTKKRSICKQPSLLV